MRLSTPEYLKLEAVVVALAAFVLAIAALTAADRHQGAVQIIGTDSTVSIAAAQRIKARLAEMDALASRMLLADPGNATADLMARYEDVRKAGHQDIGLALRNITYGAAEEVPSQRIEFILPIYQSLIDQARRAHEARDDAAALTTYRTANQLMRERLLPAADALDRANTLALNQAHAQKIDDASLAAGYVKVAGIVLVVVLVAVQIHLVVRFRRWFNPYLLVATAVCYLSVFYTTGHLNSARDTIAAAKLDIFDTVHVLERTQAKAFEVREIENLLVRDRAGAADLLPALDAQNQRILRLPDGQSTDAVAQRMKNGSGPGGLGGYLGTALQTTPSSISKQPTLDATIAYLQWLTTEQALRDAVQKGDNRPATDLLQPVDRAYQDFEPALAKAIQTNDAAFSRQVGSAKDDLAGFHVGLDWLNLGVAVLAALLAFRALSARWSEYQ